MSQYKRDTRMRGQFIRRGMIMIMIINTSTSNILANVTTGAFKWNVYLHLLMWQWYTHDEPLTDKYQIEDVNPMTKTGMRL